MNAPRRIAVLAAVAGWIHVWTVFAGVRDEFLHGDIGSLPGWLTVTLGITTTLLVGTIITGWMRLPFWPWISILGGMGFVASVVGSQYGLMNGALEALGSADRATAADAVWAVLRASSSFQLVLITAVPVLLVTSGAAGWLAARLAPEQARGSEIPEEIHER